MAQLVEQRIRNAQVAGSSPATSSRVLTKVGTFFLWCGTVVSGAFVGRPSGGSAQRRRFESGYQLQSPHESVDFFSLVGSFALPIRLFCFLR